MKIISIFSTKSTIEEATVDLKNQYQTLFGDTVARLVIYFSTSTFDPSTVCKEVKGIFGEADVFGCTTAGELVSGHMLKNSIVAMVFDAEAVLDVEIGIVENLNEEIKIEGVFKKLEEHYGPLGTLDAKTHVGIVLIDGLSGAEEKLMERIGDQTDLTFVGGSAGDDTKFKVTHVFHNNESYTNSAVVALIKTGAEFSILKTQSFKETDKRLTATKVDEKERLIVEFDGKPAATAYAEALGVSEEQAAHEFMSHPVGLMINDEPYVRSPQQFIGKDMKFYCNIKEGTSLSILDSTNIVEETKKALEEKVKEMNGVSAIINFHCILRTLELEKKDQIDAYAKLFTDIPTVGFSTYGEQYIGHMNQTSTILLFK